VLTQEHPKLPDNDEQLLRAYGDAMFDCGEWDREESDERYDDVLARADEAEVALRARIADLIKDQWRS
jgi:hypothetical protein